MSLCLWILTTVIVEACGRQVLVGSPVDKHVDPVRYIQKETAVTVPATTSTAQPSKETEKWVVDSIYYDQYQSDSTGTENPIPDFCPPIPEYVTDDACAMDVCQSDADCAEDQRCCYNGCVYTCRMDVKPAPVLDWRVEPRRFRSGVSWLIDGAPQSRDDAEPCSTAPVDQDEDPLLCPHGYTCYVDDSGTRKRGKKETQGVCVKDADQGSTEKEEIALTSSLEGRKFCTVDNVVLLEGAKIRLVDKHCRCRRGNLSCASYNSSQENGAVRVRKTKKKQSTDSSKVTKRRKRKRNKSKKGNSSS